MNFFGHLIESIDISSTSKQTFPEYDHKYDPNARREEVDHFEEEVHYIDELEDWHQP